jgi:hypothetical protein
VAVLAELGWSRIDVFSVVAFVACLTFGFVVERRGV